MPVDKFGRMSDLKTKDTGVSLTYINNNYVRSDGETPLTGSLDMRGNTLYNVADPVNPQDVVTKVYVDNTKGSGVIGRKVGDAVSIKENLDFLGKQKIKNLPDPVNDHDAVTKEYVDTTTTPFLKLDQTKYNTKGDIDMGDQFTVLNVKTPIDDNHITNKKYVDEMDNLNSAFAFKNGSYYAKGGIIMRKNKLEGLREPTQDGEAANKKYVDDLQTQYIDKRGNIKFDRNINVGNHRIFAVKDPKKDYEATNKKYVDDTITKRLQEEKDNFLPQDPATKEYVDEAIKGLAGGDLLVSKEGVFIKANGHYRATAPLDIDNHKMENLPDPVDEKDAVNKKYIDGIVENLTLKQGLIRENGGFNLVDSYINMNFNNVRNVGLPKDESDAVPRRFVDRMIKEVEEKINKRKHLITVSTYFCGKLIKGEYQFPFGGNACEEAGFLMPHSGRIKKVKLEIFGKFTRYNLTANRDILEKEFLEEIENIEELKKPPETFEELEIFESKLFKVLFLGGDLFSIMSFKNNSNEINKPTSSILSTYSCVVRKPFDFDFNPDKDFERSCVFDNDLKNHPLSEGEVINIRTEIDRNVKSVFSFMFTFLIELDPL